MKRVYVVLAFHAHEPLWDFPGQLQQLADDGGIRGGTTSLNYLVKRREEGRDIYAGLIRMAKALKATVCLEASNELLFQIEHFVPETYQKLKAAFQEELIHPILGHAHHTHASLLSEEEIEDELRLNAEYLFQQMGVPKPDLLGAFPTEDSIDSHKLRAYQRFGLDYLIFPHLEPNKCQYRIHAAAGAADTPEESVTYRPFWIYRDLMGLPRNFAISQEIWRPVTRMFPEPLRGQGYLLGDYPVFPEEYRGESRVAFPIEQEAAVNEYTGYLHYQLERAPDDALLLYIQDLELMDFGDDALHIMEKAWARIQGEERYEINFTTPRDYLQRFNYPERPKYPMANLEFDQISWAPEIRPVLRMDGHYPPLGVGAVDGVDVQRDYLRDWPFAFWEPGRYFTLLTNFLLDQVGFDLMLPVSAEALIRQQYHPERIEPDLLLRLLGRLMKRACNWGWRPDEARQKRPVGALYLIAQALADRPANPRGEVVFTEDDITEIHRGLQAVNTIFLTNRADYLEYGLKRLGWLEESQAQRLTKVRQHKTAADRLTDKLRSTLAGGNLQEIAWTIKDYCRALFLGTEELQQIWGEAPEAESLITEMYHYLYKKVPPGFPQFLHDYYGENRPEQRVGLRKTPALAGAGV